MPARPSPDGPAFTLTCPPRESPDRQVRDIRARGNLPLMIDGQMLAEIRRGDLYDSWDATLRLSPTELALMSRLAGSRLSAVLDDQVDCADLAEIVTDACVLFLLAMRRKGVRTPDEIAPCTLLWDDEEGRETVLPVHMTRYG
jgi:hypothetical protein